MSRYAQNLKEIDNKYSTIYTVQTDRNWILLKSVDNGDNIYKCNIIIMLDIYVSVPEFNFDVKKKKKNCRRLF